MKIILFILFVIFSLHVGAASIKHKEFGNAFVSEVTSIYDADTFRVNIADWPSIIGERIPVRLNGVDAPEIRGKCESEKLSARKAKHLSVALLRNAKTIELRNIKRGKYFRLIADVFIDGKSLADVLIQNQLARPYDGGKRLSWCKG